MTTLGVLNAESFCERVLPCVKMVVSDLHVSLKAEEIRILVMLRMNHGFMEYMRVSYPDSRDTPLSEFKATDTYVCVHGGVEALEVTMRTMSRSLRWGKLVERSPGLKV